VATTVDLAMWGIGFIYQQPPRTIAELTRGVPRAPAVPADAYAAAPVEGRLRSNVLVLAGYRLTTGYAGLFPASYHRLNGDIALWLSGTRWVFSPAGYRDRTDDGVPRIRLMDEQGADASGTIRLDVDRPGYLVATVNVPGRRVLAFTERFHEGWAAAIGSVPLKTVRVEHDFLGCVIEAGTYRVTLRFMSRSFVYGAIVSASGVVFLASLLLGYLIGARPR